MDAHETQRREDSVFEALRDSDPAAGVAEADLTRIRARVLFRSNATARSCEAPTHKSWWASSRLMPVAAVASVLALAGAGAVGYSAGVRNETSVPPVAAGPVAGGPVPNIGPAAPSGPGMGPGEQAPGKAMADAAIWGGFGRTVYVANWGTDVPAPTDVAEAFTYVPLSGNEGRDTLRALAKSLGVDGRVEQSGNTWSMMSKDGAKSVSLNGDALTTFYFNDSSYWASCNTPVEPLPAPDDPARGTGGGSSPGVVPGIPECQEPKVTATREGALEAAKRAMGATGLSADDFRWDVQTWEGSPIQVMAYPAGQSSDYGAAWSFTFYTNDAPAYAGGSLARLASLGEYPIVGMEEALQRLNDPRFGPLYGGAWAYSARAETGVASEGVPAPASDSSSLSVSSEDVAVSPPVEEFIPRPASPGSPIMWPVQTVTLTSASLQLVQHWQTDGSVVLVPAYLMKTADGLEVQVLAVADNALDTATR